MKTDGGDRVYNLFRNIEKMSEVKKEWRYILQIWIVKLERRTNEYFLINNKKYFDSFDELYAIIVNDFKEFCLRN